jgi:hypothetical protein
VPPYLELAVFGGTLAGFPATILQYVPAEHEIRLVRSTTDARRIADVVTGVTLKFDAVFTFRAGHG